MAAPEVEEGRAVGKWGSQEPAGAQSGWECDICVRRRAPSKIRAHRQHPGPAWWGARGERPRAAAAAALESRPAHVAVIVLTLLDLAVVLTELVLSGFYACAEEAPHAVHTAEAALSWTSISILGVFTLEQAAKLAVFGPPYFVRSAWHSLDAAIIVASLVLEAVLRGVARETVSLLIVFRLWRLVRVMHGVAESVAEEHVVRMERHHDKERALAQRVAELETQLARAQPSGQPNGGDKGHRAP